MPLTIVREGEEFEIVKISADSKVKRHLENLGILAGERITVLSGKGGSVILRVKSGRLALDKGLATKIFVK